MTIKTERNGSYTQVRITTPAEPDTKTFSITFYFETLHSIGCFYKGGESCLFSMAELENAILLAKRELKKVLNAK